MTTNIIQAPFSVKLEVQSNDAIVGDLAVLSENLVKPGTTFETKAVNISLAVGSIHGSE